MKTRISEKVLEVKPSITLAITAKAKEMIESGMDVIGFGAGEPDFDTPEFIKDAAIKAIHEGRTKYTAAVGVLELRKLIAQKLKRDNGLEYSPDQIIVNSGAKHSLSTAFQSILNPGDEVLVPVPYWVSYPEIVRIAGGVPVFLKTKKENDFKMTAEDLDKAITSKTKAIYLNSPSNPVGAVYTKKELEELAKVILRHEIFVVSDEIYERLLYDGEKHISIASLGEEIKEWTILVNGMSKSHAMTGWRIGYTAASKDVITAMGKVQGHAVSHPSSITQYAGIGALQCPDHFLSEMVEEYDVRRKFCVDRLNQIKELSYIYPKGAFYVFIDVSKLFGRTFKGKVIEGSMDYANLMLEHYQVALVPGIAFGADEFVRISYATALEQIEKGLDRMEAFIKELD
ncbi:pyridoxal phosphate-dependent aminotransferase [Alkalibacter rhizosphaerae]|uniref:Aminotransferase n=1 Tax=Alkalibacter rhizosphaerae TaxID=2815577 RepID=A0A974XH84_9FIRM|nr:pyridoxal phosphate-dependent aminotransferase [Alkalibacter rhizosphaerae]QSX08615.1 pyridoxal phosphate-dependent aminotransferase [Alkalibacter rhizosphaerae]